MTQNLRIVSTTQSQIPEIIKTIQSPYDYWAWYLWLQIKGQRVYGPHFKLHEEDAEVILKLLVWCVQDQQTAQKLNLNLNKGLLLTGTIGCGKTSLMNLIRQILPPQTRHHLKPCREIAFDYARDGYESLIPYTKGSFHPYTQTPIPICFDDLGLEPTVQHYGNQCNTMANILLSRYDYYIHHQMLTHLTTNLTSPEIEDRYGPRVRSRCREIFNLISFDKSSKDKRV